MSADFHKFALHVHQRFQAMAKGELFVTALAGDALYECYLRSFPEGTNPIYRVRTEHDCSCCKQFIRNIGNVVALVDGQLQSVWGAYISEDEYSVISVALNELVLASPIVGLFRTSEHKFGAEFTNQLLEGGAVKRWNHFHTQVGSKFHSATPDKVKGEYASAVQVFKRGLDELKNEALAEVLDLINSNSLYRGEEHRAAVQEFIALKREYQRAGATNVFVWVNANNRAARFRNTVIGTLVQDLSDGVPIDRAVASFETKVAPANYKRPTALITPRMVEDAMATIKELGLESALNRRFARLSDVSINDVIWADNSVKDLMRNPIVSALMEAAVRPVTAMPEAPDIHVLEFIRTVLPTAKSIDVLLQSHHLNNFVSLTAPMDDQGERLFKWPNNFAWSYTGNVADSIKEKVKRAGGNTNAKLRVSLAWFNYDDLDLHCMGPDGHVYFGQKMGILDVDMNMGRGTTREPVENLSWIRPRDGLYRIWVNQYQQRETSNVGFTIELENDGKLQQWSYKRSVSGDVSVLKMNVKDGLVISMEASDLIGGGVPQEKWGLRTETFCKVQTITQSPNFWNGSEIGNRHWIFVMDGCRSDEPTRGIYNEFLNSALEKHRKVFEVLGDKTKCPPTEHQLSGLGFSSTRGDVVTVQVSSDRGRRNYNVRF